MKKSIFILCILLICSSFDNKPYTSHSITINFDIASIEINDEGKKDLHSVAEFLKTYTKLKVQLEGHTDQTETKSEKEAMELSIKRAQVCKDYIVQQLKDIPKIEERILIKGFGYEQLSVPEKVNGKFVPFNQAINRRVEIRVIR